MSFLHLRSNTVKTLLFLPLYMDKPVMPPPSDNALTLEEMEAASLASLDAAAGKPRPDMAALMEPDAPAGSKWFVSIYDTPFGQYSEDDFSRICVQDWEREYIVPLALARLRNEPFCGGRYDGDVLFSVGSTSMTYWEQH